MRATLLLLLIGLAGCAPQPRAVVPVVPLGPVEREGLHNVFRLTDRVYSGSAPEDERSFESLQDLEIQTIISVDGAVPDVEGASSFGLRYVHLPIGYDGVPEDRAVAIAKVIRDLPGPVYIHCHHGKHRGPAAAAAAVRCLDPNHDRDSLRKFLNDAGTDPKYRGLFEAIDRPPPILDETTIEFPESVPVPDLVRRMVELDEVWDRLKKNPTAKDATLFVESYRELKRATKERDERFQQFLDDALGAAEDLDAAIRAGRDHSDASKKSATACSACHAKFRDNRVSSTP